MNSPQKEIESDIFIQYASTASVMDYILSAGPFHIEIHLDGLLSQYYFLMKQELHIIYFVSLDKFRFYFGLCGMVNIQFLIQEIFSIFLGRSRVGLNT